MFCASSVVWASLQTAFNKFKICLIITLLSGEIVNYWLLNLIQLYCTVEGRKYSLEMSLWKHVGFLNNLATLTKAFWTTKRSLMSHQIKTGCNTHTS